MTDNHPLLLTAALGFVLLSVSYGIIRGILGGKREARRLEALFQRVSSCACSGCGRVYGSDVRSKMAFTFDDDDELPTELARRPRITTWRIPCPQCGCVALLAEDFPNVFEILTLKQHT